MKTIHLTADSPAPKIEPAKTNIFASQHLSSDKFCDDYHQFEKKLLARKLNRLSFPALNSQLAINSQTD